MPPAFWLTGLCNDAAGWSVDTVPPAQDPNKVAVRSKSYLVAVAEAEVRPRPTFVFNHARTPFSIYERARPRTFAPAYSMHVYLHRRPRDPAPTVSDSHTLGNDVPVPHIPFPPRRLRPSPGSRSPH
jgi:hypothetical protein